MTPVAHTRASAAAAALAALLGACAAQTPPPPAPTGFTDAALTLRAMPAGYVGRAENPDAPDYYGWMTERRVIPECGFSLGAPEDWTQTREATRNERGDLHVRYTLVAPEPGSDAHRTRNSRHPLDPLLSGAVGGRIIVACLELETPWAPARFAERLARDAPEKSPIAEAPSPGDGPLAVVHTVRPKTDTGVLFTVTHATWRAADGRWARVMVLLPLEPADDVSAIPDYTCEPLPRFDAAVHDAIYMPQGPERDRAMATLGAPAREAERLIETCWRRLARDNGLSTANWLAAMRRTRAQNAAWAEDLIATFRPAPLAPMPAVEG